QQGQSITVFLTNGFQLRGVVRGFDSFIVLLESDGKQQMIYKHAISTMIPQRRLDLAARREERARTDYGQGKLWRKTADGTLRK
ncbi:MAG: RNA chaperone Hfq, partial [Intestinibacillus sp.]